MSHIENPVINYLRHSMGLTGSKNQKLFAAERSVGVLSHFGFLPDISKDDPLPEELPSELYHGEIYVASDPQINDLVVRGKLHELRGNGYNFSETELAILRESRAHRIDQLFEERGSEDKNVRDSAQRILIQIYGFTEEELLINIICPLGESDKPVIHPRAPLSQSSDRT